VNESDGVLLIGTTGVEPIAALLQRCGIALQVVPAGAPIPGSYWGEPEAGLVGATVYARADTPVHSVLHEACHTLCMTAERRAHLRTDAGGDFDEENAVCYLQICLGAQLPGVGAERVMADMDRWGYTFRLGSTQAWFAAETVAERAWLQGHGLLDASGLPTYRMRP
jgi:hypothetical protein